ncbi:hypothetical protein BDR22DRAFT_824708 [Usnea florida]
MYLPLPLISLSTVTWPTSLSVLDQGQTAVTLPTTTPTPTPAIETFEKRQQAYAPIDTREAVHGVLAGDAAENLEKRQHSARTYTGFDQILDILCPTLKALKNEDPSSFTNLLQSCTSLQDSSSNQQKRAFGERNVNNEDEKRVADADVKIDGSGKAFVGRSHENLPVKRALDSSNLVEKR